MENSLITELKMFADIVRGTNLEKSYEEMLKDAKPVKCVKMSEVFTPEEIEHIRLIVEPQQKQCYKNATLLCIAFPQAKYVEGKISINGLGIEHAWNKVGDKYVDITLEMCLGENVEDREYLAFGEYDKDTVLDISVKNRFYGDIYKTIKMKEHLL